MKRFIILFALCLCLPLFGADGEKAPPPETLPMIDCSSPRASVATFLSAMNDYKRGAEEDNYWYQNRLNDATYCLNLDPLEPARRDFYGKNASILLKEVLDRLPSFNIEKVPGESDEPRWQLDGTVITVQKMNSGPRMGDYLFSVETVKRINHFYQQVKHLPYRKNSGQGALYNVKRTLKSGEIYVKTGNPRQTMRTFMTAMNDYRDGLTSKDSKKMARINDAISCLDLSGLSGLVQEDRGRQSAIYLKEVIDRIIAIDYELIPEREPNGDPILRWRLANSNNRIAITRVTEGDHKGEYLFSSRTVKGIADFYKEVHKESYVKGSQLGAGYHIPWMDTNIPPWMKKEFIVLPNWQWVGLFLSILLGYIAKTVAQYLLSLAGKVAGRSKTEWDDKLIGAIQKPVGLVGASIFWYLSIQLLRFEDTTKVVLTISVKSIFSVAMIWAMYRLVDVLTEYLNKLAEKTDNDFDDHLVPLVRRASRTFVVIFGVLIAIQNMGFNVMSVLAGLGLGGLAFALAAKDTCANLFGSIMILTDRPFQLGDWVKAGSVEGTIEEIGFRSTRIRTFYNSQVTVPNADLANANIDNLGRREYRRTVAKLGLTYDTPPEKIEAFAEGIKNIFKANPKVRKDYFHVVFNDYGDFSLNIMIYFFFKVDDWSQELMERHNVYLEILRLAKELDVSFAFPTQSIFLENMPESGFQPQHPAFTKDGLSHAAKAFGPNGEKAQPAGSGIFLPPYKDPDLH